MAKYNVHYSVKEKGETIRTGHVKGKSIIDVYRTCQALFRCCIGKDVDADGKTTAWTFSYCEREGKSCHLYTVYCEFIEGGMI